MLIAQEKWTLDACVNYALEHNLQLNDFELNTQSNKESYKQSIRNLLPTVNGSSSYFINYGRQVNPNDNSIVNTDIFSNNYSIDGYVLAFQVMSAYYDVQFAEGLITISKEQVAISETNYKLVKRQVELGVMAGADLYEAESLLLTDKLTLTQNQNQLQALKLTLLQAMNLEGQDDIAILPALISAESKNIGNNMVVHYIHHFHC